MAQPTRFVIIVDFSDEEVNVYPGRSTVRTTQLDALFAALQLTTDEICDNLAMVQRDDGELLDGVVKTHTLSSDVLALISSGSFTVRGGWVGLTDYEVGDIVIEDEIVYLCMEEHTSSVFADDLAAARWGAITVTVSASDVSFSPTDTIEATNVQTAIAELDDDVRAVNTILSQQMFNGL